MARSLHVRLDSISEEALGIVRAEGMTDSQAVRRALEEAAASRRSRASLRAEVLALAADSEDRAEMVAVRELMNELAPDA